MHIGNAWTKADNLKFVCIRLCKSWIRRLHHRRFDTGIQLCQCVHIQIDLPPCSLPCENCELRCAESWEIECRKHFQHRLANAWHRMWLNVQVVVGCVRERAQARMTAKDIRRIQRRAKVLLCSFQNDFCSYFQVFPRTHTHTHAYSVCVCSLVFFLFTFSTCYHLSYVSNLTTSENKE